MNYRIFFFLLPPMAVFLLGYTFSTPSHQLHGRVTEPKPVPVETAVVIEKTLADQFETIGSLASTDNIDISSELSGQIAAIYFKPGTLVKKGTLLIQLDATVLKSELASANANLALSETSYERTRELTKRKLASEQALDQALADLQEKQNTVKAKKAQLEKLSLRAPFTGTLGSRQVSIGQYVRVGQPLVRLVANQKLRVEYTLPERYLPSVQVGQQVTIVSDAYPNQIYKGYVNYIDPAIDKETRTIAIEALIDNSNNLLSAGLFVRVNHEFDNKRKRLLVPEESLIPTISGQKIFVLRNDKAVAVRVKTGAHHGAMTEINSGLSVDDIVIVRGQHKLREGSHVIDIHQG
ncbi:efflux RND transporter periplasmic adaptor subunit [Legionella jamestowniensis]|uniref:Hemolysin D n=2 Tax=Legionella jamestowniensis TaxID=455 RepID=A0A0W0UKX6_9GAMM|nr:efflux RND transporter periplasmic adaptor subunit [Legionella jamestowniensis]KTD08558.1 hemolysin D [Legionella jamestowniensis]SFL52820.1 membrane fusion protein, multidrug efflux system [Legionella jamestowniensis DSM 19215]